MLARYFVPQLLNVLKRFSKSALHYQLDNKEALGYTVVDEIVASLKREKWVRPLQNAKNPIDTLIRIV